MDAREYLMRIDAPGVPPAPSLEALSDLHVHHLYSVPFETIDIYRGIPITLDLDSVIEKVVRRRRGGFCYELNTAFAWLLTELGFQVTKLSAEVAREDGSFGIPFDHMALRVDVDGHPHLADVGFGECFTRPLELKAHGGDGEYPLRQDPDAWTLFHRDTPKYRFALTPRTLDEFRSGCEYHQTSADSTFTSGVVVTIARPDGRTTLSENRLIIRRGTERTEEPIESEVAWRRALEKHFRIVLEPPS